MRTLRAVVAAGLASTLCAAIDAPVYRISQPSESLSSSLSSSGRQTPSISPSNARLYFAQKLGLSQYHSLSGADAATLEILNEDASCQSCVFEEDGRDQKTLLFVAGVVKPDDIFEGSREPLFKITDPPTSAQAFLSLSDDLRFQKKVITGGATNLVNVTYCNALEGLNGVEDSRYQGALAGLRKQLSNLKADTIVVLLPPSPFSTWDLAEEGPHPWGVYSNPWSPSYNPPSYSSSPYPDEHLNEKSQRQQQQKAISKRQEGETNATHPLTTIPSCYYSEATCIRSTNNCSSHGACYKQYTQHVSSEEDGAECWTCGCVATVKELEGGGEQIVEWGGPACQKKDVSVPFWLFTGFGVAMLVALSLAVGMLYEVGEGELPGVLGAGVGVSTTGGQARK